MVFSLIDSIFLQVLLSTDALIIIVPSELYLNTPSSFSTGPVDFNVTGRVIAADPLVSCSSVNNPEEMKGNIGLIADGACNFETQARTLQAAGAIVSNYTK